MASRFRLLDLPADILVLIFPYLEPEEFLGFCKLNRACWKLWHREPEYWRFQTLRTFRIPDHPLLHADGERWYWLYKKMRTDTRAFTWGQNTYSSLGHGSQAGSVPHPRGLPLTRHPRQVWGSHVPKQMEVPNEVGIIADLQCGGWSTTVLNSDGVLFSVGMLDAADGVLHGPRTLTLSRLTFPSGYPETTSSRTDPSTAIRTFSSGRRHILALADDGKLWSWNEIPSPGARIEFRNIAPHGSIMSIFAGWAQSTAYVRETGIVYWDPVGQLPPEVRAPADDGASVDVSVVPKTSFIAPRKSIRDADSEITHDVGEVAKHVCLEAYIVFYTTQNKVFSYQFGHENVVQLTAFSAAGREISDIQGSFRRFAVFTGSGDVLIGGTQLLERYTAGAPSTPTGPGFQPELLPVLQNNHVISLAFGDYHMHALHSNGKISSYGHDPQSLGALGLGNPNGPAKWRGLATRMGGADIIQPPTRPFPHYVWFEPEKQVWLAHIDKTARRPIDAHGTDGGSDGQGATAAQPVRATPQEILRDHEHGIAFFSEWVEQEGLAWADHPDIKAQDPDRLGAYFALNVAAAGWHSGALVLVNEALEDKIASQHVRTRDPRTGDVEWRWDGTSFPHIRLHDGFEMPGKGPLKKWRYGMPKA